MTKAAGLGVEDFLRAMLDREALLFGRFVLKSGRRSPYFFNLGAVADGSGHEIVGTAYANEVARFPVRPDVLFGPAYKGIPLAVATSMALERNHGITVGAAFNRKEPKAHGEGGTLVGAAMDGRKVAIVDDVVTDGAAKREAHETIIAAGGEVVGIVLAWIGRNRRNRSRDDGCGGARGGSRRTGSVRSERRRPTGVPRVRCRLRKRARGVVGPSASNSYPRSPLALQEQVRQRFARTRGTASKCRSAVFIMAAMHDTQHGDVHRRSMSSPGP